MTYSHREAALALGMTARAVGKWLHRRLEVGPIPGYVGGEITDETIDYIREQRASRLDRNGRVMPRAHQAFTQGPHERQMGLKDRAHVHECQPRPAPMIETFTPPPHADPIVQGLTPASRRPDAAALWQRAIDHQTRASVKADLRYHQRVEIPDSKPVLLVLLADLHLGNAATDYSQAKADAELVRDTPGCYAALLGDLIDSWIVPKLAHIQREQPFPYAEELALLESWLGMMGPKLVAVVSGNHDLRTYNQAGLDVLAHLLANVTTLYDQHETAFTLALGTAAWRWKLRHVWTHKSQYNPVHGMYYDNRFNDGSWDIAVGGHTHAPTTWSYFYDSTHDGRLKLAVQLGSYERDSSYGRQLNLARAVPGGSAGMILWPDGRFQAWHDLRSAARFLAAERARP